MASPLSIGDIDNAIEEARVFLNCSFNLKNEQVECLRNLLQDGDTLGILPTGFGKSIIYHILPVANDVLHNLTMRTTKILCVSPLVALMEDQVVSASKHGVKAIHLSELTLTEHQELGDVQLFYVSPEALFLGQWKKKLHPYEHNIKFIVVDEAHCIEGWGKDFREDYSQLGELRSFFKSAPMLALTATASPPTRKKIESSLYMQDTKTVLVCADRTNICYTSKRLPSMSLDQLSWIGDELMIKKTECPKMLIYCRTVNDCSKVYNSITEKLGDQLYIDNKASISNSLVAMYHRPTRPRNKRIILETFVKPGTSSVLRVVVCTVAFGMGVNIPDVRVVINWGASRTVSNFYQESGRAGRNGLPAVSIVYFNGHNIANTATDEQMRQFCLLDDDKCKRTFLVEHFTPKFHAPKAQNKKHDCCDLCYSKCGCGDCPLSLHTGLEDHCSDSDLLNVDLQQDTTQRTVTDRDRNIIRQELLEYRNNVKVNEASMLTSVDISTGLSLSAVEEIILKLETYSKVNDLKDILFTEDVRNSVDAIIMINLD